MLRIGAKEETGGRFIAEVPDPPGVNGVWGKAVQEPS
jgi:predicted RNase H-like HicB family nuclease